MPSSKNLLHKNIINEIYQRALKSTLAMKDYLIMKQKKTNSNQFFLWTNLFNLVLILYYITSTSEDLTEMWTLSLEKDKHS